MAKVNYSPALAEEYQRLFDACQVRETRAGEVAALVGKICANRERYESVGNLLGVPWYYIGVIHAMEATLSFATHLHNGDPLAARTVHVPGGRPKSGTPPFTWEESAVDALQVAGIHRWQDWSLPGLLYSVEGYNGWGYRLYHSHVLSPYLWSGSNHYRSGKYTADGRWSDSAVSAQLGAAVLLRRMAELGFIDCSGAGLSRTEPLPVFRYAPTEESAAVKALQIFLNTLPGIYVKVDGYAGEKTSDAFRRVTGYYLAGDPRHKQELQDGRPAHAS
jgi:lysozyme family protein